MAEAEMAEAEKGEYAMGRGHKGNRINEKKS